MAKIINEQIKKTSSVFLIISLLLNFTIYGLVFNLNFDGRLGSQVSLTKEAKAAGNASTTLTVKNSPPALVLSPFESPTSATATPINVGGSISFGLPSNAVSDQESNDFWLLICSGGTATVTPGSAPTCIGGGIQLCRSNAASSTQTVSSSTSCTYSNVIDYGLETQSWKAYVCDNHPNQPGCSLSSTGTGDSGSPFHINHAPTVTVATTSVNNVNPGSPFTVTATTSDPDILTANNTGIAVCTTNAWSTTTNSCTVATFCTSTVSAGVAHSCVSTTSNPMAHGAYSYYVFAVDSFSLSTSSSQTSTYSVNDVAPVISNISLNYGVDIGLNIKGAADKTVYATSTSVTDNNGCADLVSATSTLFESVASGGANCSPDDNNCYATSTGCVISGCSGATAKVTCTFGLKFFAQSTDLTSGGGRSGHNWIGSIRVFDGSNSTVATNSSQVIDVLQSSALDISETFIDFGVLVTGTSTGPNNATTTVNNFGNTPLDSQVNGLSMVRAAGGAIADYNQKFGNSSLTYASLPGTLSSTTPQLVTLNVSRPTSQVSTQKWIYWGIYVPGGLLSGDYGGLNTFTATVNAAGTW